MVCISLIGSHVKLNTGPMGKLQVHFYQARWPQMRKLYITNPLQNLKVYLNHNPPIQNSQFCSFHSCMTWPSVHVTIKIVVKTM